MVPRLLTSCMLISSPVRSRTCPLFSVIRFIIFPADASAPQRFGRLPAGHVGLTVGKGIGPDGAGKRLPLPQRPDAGPAPAALGAQLGVKVIPPDRPGREKRLCYRAGRRVPVKGQ